MIDKSNYQTHVIEKAIETLTQSQVGKRTQINEFDVRHTLDKLRAETNVITGWKLDETDPSKNNPIFKKAADIWQYSDSTIQTVLAQVKSNYNKDKTKYNFERKGEFTYKTFEKFVESLKVFAPMIKAEDVPNFVQSLLETVYYVQTMDRKNVPQKINILFSPVKGGGKSTFLNEWLRTAEEAGVFAGRGEFPAKMDSNVDVTPWTRNALTVDQDVQYQPDTMFFMAAGRKEEVQIVQKYAKPYLADCISETWCATNLFLKSDRVSNVINCNSYDVESLKQSFEKKFENILRIPHGVTLYNVWSYTISQLSQLSQIKTFLSNKYIRNNVDLRFEKLRGVPDIAYLLDTIQTVKDCPIDFTRVSVAQLTKFTDTPTADVNKARARLSRILKNLYSKGLFVKLVGRGAIEYEKWNVCDLLEIEAEDVFVTEEQENSTIFDEIERTRAAYDELIKHSRDFFPPFLNGSTKKLDESWNVLNKFDKEGSYNRNGDQVCVNKPLQEGKQTRKNNEVHKQNYLFECDDIPLKQQVEQIENAPKELKDALLWTCYTGGKSIHAVVVTNTPDDVTSEERKYIHQKLNEKYFGGNADPSGQNAGRLARAPNAIRQDDKHPGKKQLCLQFNMDAKPLDVATILNDCREEAKLRKTLREQTQIVSTVPKEVAINTLTQLKQWNEKRPSSSKQECIAFLEGTLDDWNRSLACVRELRHFGFTDSDIEREGPVNDRWIRTAIKGAK